MRLSEGLGGHYGNVGTRNDLTRGKTRGGCCGIYSVVDEACLVHKVKKTEEVGVDESNKGNLCKERCCETNKAIESSLEKCPSYSMSRNPLVPASRGVA